MSDYDSKAIEERGAIEVIRYFEISKVVGAYIPIGDREPFFDGHLYLYSGGKRDNEHYTGRVAAQVKGKDLLEFKDGVFSYPIEMTDLKAYLHEGVAYFVVQEVGRKKRLFYKLLTPIELRTIISEKDGQKSVSVRLTRLYDRNLKQVEIELLQFDHDCKKQRSFADSRPVDFIDLQKQGVHSFSMDITVRDKKETFLVAVTKEPVFLYANYENNVKVPLGIGRASISLLRDVEEPVKVGKTAYYNSFKSKMEGGMLTVSVGDCFKITLDPTGKKKQATLNMGRRATMLKDVITEAEFILALQKHKEVTVGALTLPIPFPDKHELTEGLDENLKAWHKLDDVLTRIHCNKDIDMSQVKKKDEVTIDIIIDMVGNGHHRSLKDVTLGINNIRLTNLNLWFLIYKDEEGKYVIKNFFDKSIGYKAFYEYPDGKQEESLYSWFDREKLMSCDNFPYDEVIPSYEALKDRNTHIYERANFLLLEIIAAYDKTEDESKKRVMYEAALKIGHWLEEKDDDSNRIIHQLNRFQLLKRSPGLSDGDKRELKRLKLEYAQDDHMSYAIALLLDDKDAYDYYWNKIDAQTQESYRERMPIYKFHK